MDDLYSGKVFEFSNIFFEDEAWHENIRIMQVGETCLDRGACIKEHIQTCHEITFIISGSGVLTADDERVECSVGDIQIISKGTKHSIISEKESRLRYIHFAFDFNEYAPKELSEFYGQCKNILLHDDGIIRMVLNMLVDEYYSNSEFTDIMRSCIVQILLIQIWRKIHIKTEKYAERVNSKPIGETVYNIIKFIDENISDKLTVAKVAKKFSYSSSYVSHLFKTKTGVSLKEYIIAIRMKYAESLIAEGKSTLAEITELTGYETIQAFCKVFKKYTGYTPSELRKNKKSSEEKTVE